MRGWIDCMSHLLSLVTFCLFCFVLFITSVIVDLFVCYWGYSSSLASTSPLPPPLPLLPFSLLKKPYISGKVNTGFQNTYKRV